MKTVIIRKLNDREISAGLELSWKVFCEFEAPDYSRGGVDEFRKSIHDPDYLRMLEMYGAFANEELAGIIALRSEGTHIALFFVRKEYQRQGIGKLLFGEALKHNSSGRMTVNSSPYAVPVYHSLGFSDTDSEQTVNGIRFTPMEVRF